MADETQKQGPLRRSSDLFHSGNPKLTARIGIVKSNIDVMHSNTLQVYLVGDTGLNPDNQTNWVTVFFLSPFYGCTIGTAPNNTAGSYVGNPASYGMWMSPPDIGTEVLCLFAQGDMHYGFWIGSLPDPAKLQMVPAIGSSEKVRLNANEATSYGGATKLPVTNNNTNNQEIANSPDFLTLARPVHSYDAHIMFQQGILRDPIRGPITSSASRETPSRVGWGVSTPGRPIYQGGFTDETLASNLTSDKANELRIISRRMGHSIVMDDGDIAGNDRLIRIRTAQGHQILMSDDGQTLMILHSNGQSYVELGKEGTVDVYSTNSINLRTQGDLNLHADNNVNIHAGKNLNLQGDNIKINSDNDFQQRSGGGHKILTTDNFTHKIGGVYAVSSGDEASLVSAASTYINGGKVNLNSGKPGTKPSDVSAIDKTLHTDTLFDKDKGFIAAPAKLSSITSRAPAHAPWSNAGQGVDVKVELTAEAALPPSPSVAVQNLNQAADAALTSGVASGAVASAPQIPKVSDIIDTKTTQALAATAASDARDGPLKAATQTGTAIVKTEEGVTAVAGAAIPFTASQMQQAGILKPGSAPLVNSVAASTGNVKLAFSPVVFASSSLNQFTNSAATQAAALSTNLKIAQTGLQNAGVLTGTETPTQVAGLALAVAKNGLPAATAALSAYAAGPTAGVALAGAASAALKDIGKGNFAANLATGLKNTMSGPQAALTALKDKLAMATLRAKGASAALFTAIKKGLKDFKKDVPQDLGEIAKQNAAGVANAGLSAATNALSQAAGAAAQSAIASNPTLLAATAVLGAASGSSASSVASGLTTLPGAASAVSAINSGTTPNLPGTADLKKLMQNASTSAMSGLAQNPSAALATAALGTALQANPLTSLITNGLPAGVAAQVMNTLNSLVPPGSGLKMPTISTGTVNRSAVDGTAKGQLFNPKVPEPVWDSPKTGVWDDIQEKSKKYDSLLAEVSAVEAKIAENTSKSSVLVDKQLKLPYESRNPDNPDYSSYTQIQEQLVALYKEKATLSKELIDKSKAAQEYYTKTFNA